MGDKLNLRLNYDQPKNKAGNQLHTGLLIQNGNGKLYPATMTAKRNETDYILFETKGLLDYDPTLDAFYFGDSLKIVSGVRGGNLLTYDNENGTIQAEGEFNFFSENDVLVATAAGVTKFEHQKDQDEISEKEFELLVGFDLFLPSKLMKIIETDIVCLLYTSDAADE